MRAASSARHPGRRGHRLNTASLTLSGHTRPAEAGFGAPAEGQWRRWVAPEGCGAPQLKRQAVASTPVGSLYVGVSGFSYPEWKGDFYPAELPAGRFLEFYSTQLNAVELNNTFYRFPRETAVAAWLRSTPDGFRFCLKAQRSLTYSNPRFPRGEAAASFGRSVKPLGDRLGPLLLQLPPAVKRDPDLLDTLLGNLGVPTAVEFRDPGWLDEDVYSVIRSHGGALVVTDQEDWPMAPRRELSGFAYYRLRRDYDGLGRWPAQIQAEVEAREAVYVFLRHHPKAPARALGLARLAGAEGSGQRRSPAAPSAPTPTGPGAARTRSGRRGSS
ncbi:MAG: DUF72 domain-containing protein [Chloroflexi bacterium]|nr:MAG: DUF72 domain-containing protein [Chloroflexota bacterium]TME19823.1 MAG: DUF72 domain-containing protein [Chloroflexota bacterium]